MLQQDAGCFSMLDCCANRIEKKKTQNNNIKLEEANKEAVNDVGNFRALHLALLWFLHLIRNSQWILQEVKGGRVQQNDLTLQFLSSTCSPL